MHERDVALTPMQVLQEDVPLPSLRESFASVSAATNSSTLPAMAMCSADPCRCPPASIGTRPRVSTRKAKKASVSGIMCRATRMFQENLTKDPNHLPAPRELASLANRRGDSAAASDHARQALRIDTYDPAANYQFGMASLALGRFADAKDAFSVAALAMGWRAPRRPRLPGCMSVSGNTTRTRCRRE